MLSAIVPKLNWGIPLGAWPILDHRVPAQTFTVVVGFFLIMLSYGLARGKQHAWLITVILLILSALLHMRRSGSILATVIALLLAILLSILARFFHARSDPPSVRTRIYCSLPGVRYCYILHYRWIYCTLSMILRLGSIVWASTE